MSVRQTRTDTVINAGAVTVSVGRTLELQADQIAAHFAPDLVKIMDQRMAKLVADGVAKWPRPGPESPRATGRSLAAMDYRSALLSSDGAITTSLRNAARNPRDGFEYPYAIRTKQSKGKAIWTLYFARPFLKMTKAAMSDMVDAFNRLSEVD